MTEKNKYLKISIVTVNYNNAPFLEETIQSVLNQNYPNLEYIIIDGGSTDGSVDIIKKYENELKYWVSEPDSGPYYAVQKGFDRCTGEVMAWLNSDDKYLTGSFFAVNDIFNQFDEVNWLMGLAREYNAKGSLIGRIQIPWCRWSKGRYYTNDFQFIQQESCFWRKSLWEKSGSQMSTEYQLAGDMELWSRFFKYEKLHTTLTELAGFRHHSNEQRSKQDLTAYLKECRSILKREKKGMSFLTKIGYFFMSGFRFLFGPFFFFNVPLLKLIYPMLFSLPKLIHYNFEKGKYIRGNKTVQYPPILWGDKQIHFGSFRKKQS